MRIVVHIGAHKTATTHLQRCLGTVRAALAAGGVRYIGPPQLRDEEISIMGALGDPVRNARALQHWTDRLTAIRKFRTLLVSDENIVGVTARERFYAHPATLYPTAEDRLRVMMGALGHRPVTLALAVREPGALAVSAWGLRMSAGSELDFDAYADGFDLAAPLWSALAARLLALPKVTRLIVWRYEDLAVVRGRVLDALLGDPDLARTVPDLPAVNVGWSAEAVAAWRAAAPGLPSDDARRELARACRTLHPKLPGASAPIVLDPARHAAAREGYVADMARLARLPGVEMIGAA